MLEGRKIRLRIMEKEDIPTIWQWTNNLNFTGEHNPITQQSKTELEKKYENFTPEHKVFIIEKKNNNLIGFIWHFPVGTLLEIGYAITPNERGKGYCTEAAQILLDYIFLSKDLQRIQARTDTKNKASQRILEKIGFKKEGILRKSIFSRGKPRDAILYSILRQEWKQPKILEKTSSR